MLELPTAPAVSDAPAVTTNVPDVDDWIRPLHVVPFDVATSKYVPSMSAPTSFTPAPSLGVTVKNTAMGDPAHTGPLAQTRTESPSPPGSLVVTGVTQSSNMTSSVEVPESPVESVADTVTVYVPGSSDDTYVKNTVSVAAVAT